MPRSRFQMLRPWLLGKRKLRVFSVVEGLRGQPIWLVSILKQVFEVGRGVVVAVSLGRRVRLSERVWRDSSLPSDFSWVEVITNWGHHLRLIVLVVVIVIFSGMLADGLLVGWDPTWVIHSGVVVTLTRWFARVRSYGAAWRLRVATWTLLAKGRLITTLLLKDCWGAASHLYRSLARLLGQPCLVERLRSLSGFLQCGAWPTVLVI